MIDSHAHLDSLAGPETALQRAWEAGVDAVVAVAMGADSAAMALELAAKDPRVWPALGLHPWEVAEDTWQEQVDFAARNLGSAVAVGECGLDYKKKVPKKLQQVALAAQLELAAVHNLPALVHCRFSEHRVLDLLNLAGVKGVFHWFAGDLAMLERVLEAGHFISATPSVASSPTHRAAVKACPLGRLLLETDAPVEHGGKPTEPARVVETCALVAELKEISREEVERVTDRNAEKLFGRKLGAGS